MYSEDDYLSLSGIQHFAFCRRQWALIHIEQQWQENLRTIEGEILHQKAHDKSQSEMRNGIIITRAMPIASREIGISGVCDVVEFHPNSQGIDIFGWEGKFIPIPIEYKRGEPKEDDCDELQLCAKALCLEEMLVCEINVGYLFYGETRRRYEVKMSQELREKTLSIFYEMHELYSKRYTPKVKTSKACKACSLNELCIPKLCKEISVKDYISKRIGDE